MHLSRSIDVVDLVEAARSGSQQAFDELYRRYHLFAAREIFALVKRPHVTADLLQVTFMQAFTRLGNLRDPACFQTWLQRIAHARACDWLEAHTHGKIRYRRIGGDVIDPRPGPLAELEQTEERQLLDAGLERTLPKDRQLLQAYHQDRMPVKEIAARYGKPIGTIKRRLHDARRRLKRLIETVKGLLSHQEPRIN
jgi:RNA polymerase sigma-70 factor (ECF subfamily)